MSTNPPLEGITHTASLPHGYRVQFAWSPEGRFREVTDDNFGFECVNPATKH